MGMYNQLFTEMLCPRCGACTPMDIEFKYGYLDMTVYSLGDPIQWRLGREIKNGGRPPGGSMEADGYAECSGCKKDFWVTIKIVNDRITSVQVDNDRKPYTLDES